jgi:chromosome partitioning protein
VKTVTFLNQKGGVGKTTCTMHVGASLALSGRRVLLVDTDPQGSLTQGFYGPEAFYDLDPARTIAAVLLGHDPYPEDVVLASGMVAGLDVLPGATATNLVNEGGGWQGDPAAQARLRNLLSELSARYDLALVDCQPTLYNSTRAAVAAADALVVPVQPEDFGAQGIAVVQDFAAELRAGVNPALALAGYLITMFRPRAAIHRLYAKTLREAYGREVFDAEFIDSLEYKEATAQRKPIGLYKPKGAAAKAVRAIAEELVARLDGAIGGTAAPAQTEAA